MAVDECSRTESQQHAPRAHISAVSYESGVGYFSTMACAMGGVIFGSCINCFANVSFTVSSCECQSHNGVERRKTRPKKRGLMTIDHGAGGKTVLSPNL